MDESGPPGALRIGVLSDTHLHDRPLPDSVVEALEGVDMVLHAGDILDLSVIERLSVIAETHAVKGNMDHGETARALPARKVIEVGGFRIGLVHGHGAPTGMVRKVRSEFGEVDCIVFGHTHRPMVKEVDGVLYFNPGSATDRMFTSSNSVGILEIGDSITPRIIEIPR